MDADALCESGGLLIGKETPTVMGGRRWEDDSHTCTDFIARVRIAVKWPVTCRAVMCCGVAWCGVACCEVGWCEIHKT